MNNVSFVSNKISETTMAIYLRKCDSLLRGNDFIDRIKESYPKLLNKDKFWSKRLKSDIPHAEELFSSIEGWNQLTSYQKYLYCSSNFCEPQIVIELTFIMNKQDTNLEMFEKSCIEKMTTVLDFLGNEGVVRSIVDAPFTEVITTRFQSKAIRCTTKFQCYATSQIDLSNLKNSIETTANSLVSGDKSGLRTTSCEVSFPDYKLVTPYNAFNENYLEYTVITDTKDWMLHPSQFSANRLANMMVEVIEEFDCYLSVNEKEKSSTRVRMYLKDNVDRLSVADKLRNLHKLLNDKCDLQVHL